MKIAILAWGSLFWDKRELAIVGDWQAGGPVLPIEFSRISSDGRLTLVIDPQNGANVTTLFARSSFGNFNGAFINLCDREKTSADKIGFVNLLDGTKSIFVCQKHAAICNAIEAWAQANGWQAVLWTALQSNFTETLEKPFSPVAAIAYIQKLPREKREKATEYLLKAASVVDTPVWRKFMEIRNRHRRRRPSATAKAVLGHKMSEEPLPDAPKIIVPNSWHGKRKKRT